MCCELAECSVSADCKDVNKICTANKKCITCTYGVTNNTCNGTLLVDLQCCNVI